MRFADQVAQGREELARSRQRRAGPEGARAAARGEARRPRQPAVVSTGKVEFLGTAIVEPTDAAGRACSATTRSRRPRWSTCMRFERDAGWEPTDVSASTTAPASTSAASAQPTSTGIRPLRRIEVKGRAGENLPVELTPNEWVQAGRHRETFWLYVVWNAKTAPRLVRIKTRGTARRRRGAQGRKRLPRSSRGDCGGR